MLRFSRAHHILGEFVPAAAKGTPWTPLIKVESRTWKGLPAARIKQFVEKDYLISLLRLAVWIVLTSKERAQIVGAFLDTNENAIEILIAFVTEVHRSDFQIAVHDDLAGWAGR